MKMYLLFILVFAVSCAQTPTHKKVIVEEQFKDWKAEIQTLVGMDATGKGETCFDKKIVNWMKGLKIGQFAMDQNVIKLESTIASPDEKNCQKLNDKEKNCRYERVQSYLLSLRAMGQDQSVIAYSKSFKITETITGELSVPIDYSIYHLTKARKLPEDKLINKKVMRECKEVAL